jgi:hypothetical protein
LLLVGAAGGGVTTTAAEAGALDEVGGAADVPTGIPGGGADADATTGVTMGGGAAAATRAVDGVVHAGGFDAFFAAARVNVDLVWKATPGTRDRAGSDCAG